MICPMCKKRRLNKQAARIVVKGHCEACDYIIDIGGLGLYGLFSDEAFQGE